MNTALYMHGPCPYLCSHTYCASHALTTPSCFRTLCHVTVQVWLYMFICLALLYIVYKPHRYRYSTPDLFWLFSPAALCSPPCSRESDLKALSPKVADSVLFLTSSTTRIFILIWRSPWLEWRMCYRTFTQPRTSSRNSE